MLKNIFSKLTYLLYVLIIVGIGLEIFLRFFSPVPVRLKGNNIVLPKNQQYNLPNEKFTKISKNAVHTKNSIGFRGEEWDLSSKRTKMLFVGGSTTECFYIDDKKHWPYLLSQKLGPNFLVNNAGLNGHSTVGHISLLNGYLAQLKPDYAFFLIGINDLATTDNGGNSFDSKLVEKNMEYFVLQIEEYSRLVNLLHSFYRSYQAFKLGVKDNAEWHLESQKELKSLPQNEMDEILKKHKNAQEGYKKRILEIINICKSNNVKPVFLTQPLLFGEGIDPTTGLDLAKYQVYIFSGLQYSQKLEPYNQTLRQVCTESQIQMIDLAKLLPKDSKYFFDDMHFSDAGCEKISEIIFENWEK
ncbi:SGNH/GDSL hydrolase family protein [Lacihabitans soyangensis]|uniref:SGNH/GDSL hydrolase family protein n=1 Tax=Lacihabitans soyangensis TaxID=869394 RepID=A0AAE3KVS7_9BACT|nr:SGNH/GDSL hydrolase family protein [Lacihabitans soyangensis]MCP9764541.1 SGNH/GDSL hydrolase family protein [Lacihabitans soyangensis]